MRRVALSPDGVTVVVDDMGFKGPAAQQLETSTSDDRIFTGIAFNPSIMEEAGKRYVKFELNDYWTILESKLIKTKKPKTNIRSKPPY